MWLGFRCRGLRTAGSHGRSKRAYVLPVGIFHSRCPKTAVVDPPDDAIPRRTYARFSDDAVSEEAAEHQFRLIQADNDLSEAWFEIK